MPALVRRRKPRPRLSSGPRLSPGNSFRESSLVLHSRQPRLGLAKGHLVVDVEPPAFADIVDEGAAVLGEALDAFGQRAGAAFVEAEAERIEQSGGAVEDAG